MASRTLTIEVGNEFIKICEMQQSKGNVMVHHAISVQTPPDAVEDGFIRDVSKAAEAIRTAMTEDQIVANEVTFILNSSRVASKEVILPLVKRDKIQELVNLNASEYFPVNIDDYVLSYTVLEEKKTKEEQKSRILVFAAPELMVQSYFDLAGILGMKVKAVDYAGNSTLQLIKIQIDEKPTLVVQLGMDTTIVSVMSNNILQLQRTIPYGESLLLNSVMESRNVKAKVALELLASAQIVKDTLDRDETTGSLKYLISNVNRVIEYYSGRNQEAPLQKIVIIGEGADVLGMDVLFANETSLPTERLTVLKRVESYNRIKVSTSLLKQYMANIGASLDPIHLEPKARQAAQGQSSKGVGVSTAIYAVVAVALVAVAAVVAVIPMSKYKSQKNKKEDIQKEITELEPVEKIYSVYNETLARAQDMLTFYISTIDNTDWSVEMMEYLEEIMPSDSMFSSMEVNQGAVYVEGIIMKEYEIAGFIQSLEEEEHISNIITSGYEWDYDANYIKFDLNFDITGDTYRKFGEDVINEILGTTQDADAAAGEEAK